jgi:hypothetical protein
MKCNITSNAKIRTFKWGFIILTPPQIFIVVIILAADLNLVECRNPH